MTALVNPIYNLIISVLFFDFSSPGFGEEDKSMVKEKCLDDIKF
jgi:hypothetical protein